MKNYRLLAWPQLRPPFDRIAYRRMLSDLSHRDMTVGQLVQCSGLRRHEVRAFLDMLDNRQLIVQRNAEVSPSKFGPLGTWLRQALDASTTKR